MNNTKENKRLNAAVMLAMSSTLYLITTSFFVDIRSLKLLSVFVFLIVGSLLYITITIIKQLRSKDS